MSAAEQDGAPERDLAQSFKVPAGGHGVARGETVTLSADEVKARKRRNAWIALAIGAFVLLVFAITIAKLSAGQPI